MSCSASTDNLYGLILLFTIFVFFSKLQITMTHVLKLCRKDNFHGVIWVINLTLSEIENKRTSKHHRIEELNYTQTVQGCSKCGSAGAKVVFCSQAQIKM